MKKIFIHHAVVSLVIILLLSIQIMRLNANALGNDWEENSKITYYLAHEHKYAIDSPFDVTNTYLTFQREPLPILFWAAAVNFNPNWDKVNNFDSFVKSGALLYAKYTNLAFMGLVLVFLYLLVLLIPSDIASNLEKTIVYFASIFFLYFLKIFSSVNSINTDIHSAALLLLCLLIIIRYFKNKTLFNASFVGICYALLCLTKAAFFYCGILISFLILIWQLCNNINHRHFIIMIISCGLAVSPWLIRNYMISGQFVMSERGPETMVDRVFEEIFNDAHYKGMYFAYSPDFIKPIATLLTGYNSKDRELGGRLQYSTREQKNDNLARLLKRYDLAINSHYKAGIWMSIVYDKYYLKFNDHKIAKKLSKQAYKKFILNEFIDNPMRYLKFSFLFAWRGLWVTNYTDGRSIEKSGKNTNVFIEMLPGLGFFSLITITVSALKQKNNFILALCIIPIMIYIFYAFFTHNIPRYSLHLVPIWILSLSIVFLNVKKNLLR